MNDKPENEQGSLPISPPSPDNFGKDKRHEVLEEAQAF